MNLPDGTYDFSFDFCPPSPSEMRAADSLFQWGRLLPLGAPLPPQYCPLPAESEKTQQAYGDLEGLRRGPKYMRLKSVQEEYETVSQTQRPRLSWYVLFFGSVKAPEAMEIKDIRSRRRRRSGGGENVGSKRPWKLLCWLSCTGVETVAAAVPVSFV